MFEWICLFRNLASAFHSSSSVTEIDYNHVNDSTKQFLVWSTRLSLKPKHFHFLSLVLSRQDVLQNVLLKFVSFIIWIYYVAFMGNAFISGKSLTGWLGLLCIVLESASPQSHLWVSGAFLCHFCAFFPLRVSRTLWKQCCGLPHVFPYCRTVSHRLTES